MLNKILNDQRDRKPNLAPPSIQLPNSLFSYLFDNQERFTRAVDIWANKRL